MSKYSEDWKDCYNYFVSFMKKEKKMQKKLTDLVFRAGSVSFKVKNSNNKAYTMYNDDILSFVNELLSYEEGYLVSNTIYDVVVNYKYNYNGLRRVMFDYKGKQYNTLLSLEQALQETPSVSVGSKVKFQYENDSWSRLVEVQKADATHIAGIDLTSLPEPTYKNFLISKMKNLKTVKV